MKKTSTIKTLSILLALVICLAGLTQAQTFQWQLVNPTYSPVDPDGLGPATGVVTFKLQVRTTGADVPEVTAFTLGYSYQSGAAMLPTTTNCTSSLTPNNHQLSQAMIDAGFTYETVNQCNAIPETAGGINFDRKTAGSLLSGPGLTLTTAWTDLFTVTLWSLGASFPQGGYVMINSGFGGSPGPVSVYGISDLAANDNFIVNSLTYDVPLALGGALPVLFTNFDAKCSSNGNLITWATAQEENSSSFEIQRSTNGTTWSAIGSVPAAGSSTVSRNYQQIDLIGGTAFYRIKQLDKNGQAIYSNIARTNCQVKNISSVLYPVPASDVLNVVIKSDKAVRTQLMVYDMHGKLVKKLDATVFTGNNNFRINLLGLPSGDYMLRSNDSVLELNKIFTISR